MGKWLECGRSNLGIPPKWYVISRKITVLQDHALNLQFKVIFLMIWEESQSLSGGCP